MLLRLLEFWARYSKCEVITGHGDTTPYLVRAHLINNRFFKLYLHRFMRSDLEHPHDHPWSSLSLGVQGEYTEQVYDWRTRTLQTFRRKPGRFVWRPRTLVHRILIDLPSLTVTKSTPTTLFLALSKTQDWGFVENYETGPRWVLWSEYLKENNK